MKMMKSFWSLSLIALSMNMAHAGGSKKAEAPAASAGAVVGQAAPNFELKGADGKTYSLASLKGKNVILEWLNHECPFVKKHYNSGNMQKLQADAAKAGIVWLSVATSAVGEQGHLDAPAALKISKEKKSKATTVLLDAEGVMGTAYAAKVTPHMYVIDTKGVLVYAGPIDSKATTNVADVKTATPYIAQVMAQLAKAEPVTVKANEAAYGCGIKYKK